MQTNRSELGALTPEQAEEVRRIVGDLPSHGQWDFVELPGPFPSADPVDSRPGVDLSGVVKWLLADTPPQEG